VKVDREVEAPRAERPAQRDVGRESFQPARARRDQDFVEVRVGGDDRRGMRLDDVGQPRVGKVSAEGANGGRREDDVPDLT
jgi:hypothetical protein